MVSGNMTQDALNAHPEHLIRELLAELNNTGRWGKADRRGTLNHITTACVAQAATEVRAGRVISLSHVIPREPHVDDIAGPAHLTSKRKDHGFVDDLGARVGVTEQFTFTAHGFTITHVDALSHVHWNGRMYNDLPSELVDECGATELDVVSLGSVVTRGVLIDAARFRGVSRLEPGETLTATELDAILTESGTTLRAGDAVFLRTGYGALEANGDRPRSQREGRPGWHPECMRTFQDASVAIIGADVAQDAFPTAYPGHGIPIHLIALSAMGMPLIDNMALEELATHCALAQRWTFQFVLAPLRFPGATGSPANPLAVM